MYNSRVTTRRGRAEPGEIQGFSQAAQSAAGGAWGAFCQTTWDSAFDIFAAERKRALSRGAYVDGDGTTEHGMFFVQAINGICKHIGEPHLHCVQRLMSYDPISTFFILFDPLREDEALNSAIKRAAGKIEYEARADANASYRRNMEAAFGVVSNPDGLCEVLKKLRRGPGAPDIAKLCDWKCKFYDAVASNPDGKYEGVDFASSLSAATRSRMCVYDCFRFDCARLSGELYPCDDAESSTVLQPYISDEEARMGRFRAHVDAHMRSAESHSKEFLHIDGPDDLARLATFICSDAFAYVPLDDAHREKLCQGVEEYCCSKLKIEKPSNPQVLMKAILSLSVMAPIPLQKMFEYRLGKIY